MDTEQLIKDLFLNREIYGTEPRFINNYVVYINNDTDSIRNIFLYDILKKKEKQLTTYKNPVMGFDVIGDRYIFVPVNHYKENHIYDIISGNMKILKKNLRGVKILHPYNKNSFLVTTNNLTFRKVNCMTLKVNIAFNTKYSRFFVDKNLDIMTYTVKKNNSLLLYYKDDLVDKGDRIYIKAVSYDDKYIYYNKHTNNDQSQFIIYDTMKKESKVLYKYSGSIPTYIKDNTGYITGIGVYYHDMKYIMFAEDDNHIKNVINHCKCNNFKVIDSNNSYWILKIMPSNTSSYYILYNKKDEEIIKLYVILKNLDKYKFMEEKVMIVKASDGLHVPCFVNVPGANKPHPTIFMIHGGPYSRYEHKFDPESQFFVSMGYATVRINFRGSVIDHNYKRMGIGQYGDKMISDIIDVTKYFINNGITDKNKVGVYGFSYGGYATLMAMIRESQLYKFGIACMGLINVKRRLLGDPSYMNLIKKSVDNPFPKDILTDATNKRISPEYHYKKIKGDLLLIYGKKDIYERNDFKIMYNKMKEHGQNVDILGYDEGHGIYKKENIMDMWLNISKFLKKYLVDYEYKYHKYKRKYMGLKNEDIYEGV